MSENESITIANVELVEGPLTPTSFGVAAIADSERIQDQLIAMFGKAKADAAWPMIEKMILGAIQAARDAGTEGKLEMKGIIPL